MAIAWQLGHQDDKEWKFMDIFSKSVLYKNTIFYSDGKIWFPWADIFK